MSTSPLFAVHDPNELNALLRVFIQAKFRPAIPDTDIPASPFVVAMVERILQSQKNLALAESNQKLLANLAQWQQVAENPFLLSAVRERIRECPTAVWERWSREERLNYVQQILSPFTAEEALLEELLATNAI